MQTQITMRNISRSTALSKRIRDLSDHLDRYHPHILTCRVALEQATARSRKDKLFEVTVRVRVPGRELVATHGHDEDVYIALRDTFDAMRRQLINSADATQGEGRLQREAELEVPT